MFKLMITVTVLLQLLLQTECLYVGDSCLAEGALGLCVPLLECAPILDEVKRAGNPIPPHMRMKLQKLTCGYQFKDPMVCCVSLDYTDTERPSTHTFTLAPDDSDNVEAYTRATPQSQNGPIGVETHPNLNLLPMQCGNIDSDRIFGGNRTQLFEMPWMVLLSYDSARGPTLSCGGSLISEWYVLTAAHCVGFLGNRLQLKGVVLGEHDIRQDPDCEMSDDKEYCAPRIQNVPVGEVVAHPGYTPQSLTDDIALVRLARPANFSLPSVKPLCLPITRKLQLEPLKGKDANVAGWGATEEGLQSPVLLKVELPITSPEECTQAYRGSVQVKQTQLCAGGVKGKDSCGGDSGGPLMYPGSYGKFGARYVQRGLVSFGPKRCGLGGYPGVYTNIAYYMKWILDNMHS
ncbi:hypothetical protein PYW07_007946 [Mythimna separata]|uniref:CLIP domain-containing serine protease n=1 Tax=Mythimna separata TaxID=271217 RepID=A0AAD7YRT6_MYTSE|nr:hypothetical protein PYW07_007946 [Mythimna separata]